MDRRKVSNERNITGRMDEGAQQAAKLVDGQ